MELSIILRLIAHVFERKKLKLPFERVPSSGTAPAPTKSSKKACDVCHANVTMRRESPLV